MGVNDGLLIVDAIATEKLSIQIYQGVNHAAI
jgi:hypothetical protein